MSLALGTRLGPYEVTAQIGVGGMGEVYRATDTNLARQVAIKVLPAAVAADAERLARFDREAKTLAALNHPNIAAIYGLEKSAGTTALVMELVEGPTLADRIGSGPIPIDEALPIAKQIAEALEAAHEQGIIHRDLKPANIKVRSDGTVKVLDFGLAKAMDPAGARSPGDLANSPTITSPAMTQAGTILGTAAYMSPEQARGKPVDRRADVWAFGCILYEMVTGRRVFTGEDVSDMIAAVLRAEVDWTPLPPAVSPVLRTYLQRCLSKDPRQRIGDMQTMRLALEGALDIPVLSRPQDAQPARPRRTGALTLAAALTSAAVTGVAVWVTVRPDPPRLTRLAIPTDGAAPFTPSRGLSRPHRHTSRRPSHLSCWRSAHGAGARRCPPDGPGRWGDASRVVRIARWSVDRILEWWLAQESGDDRGRVGGGDGTRFEHPGCHLEREWHDCVCDRLSDRARERRGRWWCRHCT